MGKNGIFERAFLDLRPVAIYISRRLGLPLLSRGKVVAIRGDIFIATDDVWEHTFSRRLWFCMLTVAMSRLPTQAVVNL